MTKSLCLLFNLLVVLCINSHPSWAEVSRANLIAETQQKAEAVLLQRLERSLQKLPSGTTADQSKVAETKKQIRQRAKILAGTINNLPIPEVDDELAAWIQDSIVAELNGLGLHFMREPDPSKDAFNTFKLQAENRFATLNNEKGKLLLQKKVRYLKSAKSYHNSLRGYLAEKFARIDDIQLEVTPEGIQPFVEALVVQGAVNDTMVKLPNSSHSIVKDTLDLRKQDIDSKLITLGFIREIKQRFNAYSRMDWFGFASITSGAYAEGDPRGVARWKNFEDVKGQVDELFATCISKQDGFIRLSYSDFSRFLSETGVNLRWKNYKPLNEPKPGVNQNYILFHNEKDSWKLLLTEDHALSQVKE